MNKMSDTAVILINYNNYQVTLDCIRSILNSTYACDIIVVDNSENEDDYKKLKALDDQIIVLRPGSNVGFAAGNNLGLRTAIKHGYDYFVILNNDTVIDSSMIDELKKYCDDKTICLPVMYYYYDKEKIWYAGGKINKYKGSVQHINAIISNRPYRTEYVTGCCFMISRNALIRTGFFDEQYFMYCEDWDFSMKLIANNYSALIVPQARLWHKVGESSKKISGSVIYYNNRNRIKLIKKFRKYFSTVTLPYIYLSRIGKILRLLLKGDRSAKYYFRGLVDGIKGKSGRVS